MIENKKVAILMASDEDQAFAVANVIIGLKRYNKDLVDTIFIYHEMSNETINKISNIWKDKIIFVEYNYEKFKKDLIDKNNIIIGNRWKHYIYAKAYLFKILENYDYAIWLDNDVLILNNIEPILAKNVDCRWKVGDKHKLYKLLTNELIKCEYDDCVKPNGGIISLSSTILKKNNCKNLFNEFFYVLNKCFTCSIINSAVMSDEIPFGFIKVKYKLSFEDFHDFANVLPDSTNKDSIIIHTVGYKTKFWNNTNILDAYQEWFVNHKIWNIEYNKSYEFNKHLSYDLHNVNGNGYIYRTVSFLPMVLNIVFKINFINVKDYADYKLYISFLSQDKIVIKSLLIPNISYIVSITSNLGSIYDCFCTFSVELLNKEIYNIGDSIGFNNFEVKDNGYNYYLNKKIKWIESDILNEYKNILSNTLNILKKKFNSNFKYENNVIYNIKDYFNKELLNENNKVFCIFEDFKLYIVSIINNKIMYFDNIYNGKMIFCDKKNNIDYVINIDNSISFLIKNMYISSRKGESLSLKDKNMEWEHFYLYK